MDSLAVGVCAALLVTSLLPSEVLSHTDVYIDGTPLEDQPPEDPYLWFGPRLGRRKRTLDDRGSSKSPILEESVISVFDDAPWAFMPLKNFQERTLMGYSPNMARQVEEATENAKAPPFAPRLGRQRKLLPFSPRLGRELMPETVERFERSLGKSHYTKL